MLDAAIDPRTLTDVEALRALVQVQRDQIAERDATIRHDKIHIAALTQELSRYKRWAFAAKSEKLDPAQRALFADEVAADLTEIEVELHALRSAPSVKAQPKREALPAHRPRETTVLDPDSCQCMACGGVLERIGEEVNEQLDCRPIAFA